LILISEIFQIITFVYNLFADVHFGTGKYVYVCASVNWNEIFAGWMPLWNLANSIRYWNVCCISTAYMCLYI